jgi:hypothetical protein
VEAASEIDGFKLQMYAPLEGPAGAHHQPKSRTGSGIMFPKKTAERDDFERIVRTIVTNRSARERVPIGAVNQRGALRLQSDAVLLAVTVCGVERIEFRHRFLPP